jgi:hypothetical protein
MYVWEGKIPAEAVVPRRKKTFRWAFFELPPGKRRSRESIDGLGAKP